MNCKAMGGAPTNGKSLLCAADSKLFKGSGEMRRFTAMPVEVSTTDSFRRVVADFCSRIYAERRNEPKEAGR